LAREYLNKQAKLLRHSRNWLRLDYGGDEYLKSLCESYLARPLYPIIVTPELEVVDGNLRLESIDPFAPNHGETEVSVCITDEPVTPALLIEIQLDSAAHTKGLSDYEQFVGYSEWLKLTGATAKQLAARIHRNETILSKILSLEKGVQSVKDAAAEGKLNYSKWWAICKLPPEEQPALLRQHLSGATRDDLERESRKRRNGEAKPTARASKISIRLTGGMTVTISGASLSLDEAIEAVAEAGKEMRKGRDQGLDSKTIQAVMRDKSKAGG
jgi:hypothetical protein